MDGMIRILFFAAGFVALTLPFTHPFGNVKEQRSPASLPGDAKVVALLERACQNCHSEKTQWPAYSYFPVASWAIEKDVAEGRAHLNFSHWNDNSAEDKRYLLARIGAMVRNRQMPLPRYVMLHTEARFTDAEIQIIYDWTKTERRALRRE